MIAVLALLVAMSVGCDVGGQLCFKHGVNKLPSHDEGFRLWLLWRDVVGNPWLWLGIAIYGIELVVWLNLLSRVPLSLAYPLGSLNFCGVLLASRFLLGEPVSPRRWLGAALITLGVVVVGAGGL